MANLTRIDPFREMVTLRHVMDRLFEEPVISPLAWRRLEGETLTPALDVHETDDDLVITAALPGVKAEDVDISITGQALSIRGEMKADEKVERDRYIYRERRFGSFHRRLSLPVLVSGEKATATYEDGLLTLRIPKAEEVKPRQIQVKAEPKQVESSTDGDGTK